MAPKSPDGTDPPATEPPATEPPATAVSSGVSRAGSPAANGAGTFSNVGGTDRLVQRPLGQTMTNARPITFSIGTWP